MRDNRPDILDGFTPRQRKRWKGLQEARKELESRIPKRGAAGSFTGPQKQSLREWLGVVAALGRLVAKTRKSKSPNRCINNTARCVGLKIIAAAIETLQGRGVKKDSVEGQNARDDARSFLMGLTPAWANSRRAWCAAAEIHPKRLEKRAIELQGVQG